MILKKNKNYFLREVEEGIVLANLEDETIVFMNEMANLIWKQLDETTDLEEISKYIFDFYDAGFDQIFEDVQNIVKKLTQADILIKNNKPALNENFVAYKTGQSYALFFPYKRLILKVTEKTHAALKEGNLENLSEEDFSVLEQFKIIGSYYPLYSYKNFLTKYPTKTILLPTSDCNLLCKYCYASAGIKKNEYMSWNMAKKALDYVFSNHLKKYNDRKSKKHFVLGFMGGGEPTLNWEVVTKSTDYIHKLGKKEGVPVGTDLTTNAYLKDEKLNWICKNIDFIRISFDGPEDIQNHQRPALNEGSFDVVCNAIHTFDKYKKDYLIRCTVTGKIVDRMPEILQFYIDNFNMEGKSLIFNPVYVSGSCVKNDISSINPGQFSERFIECQKIGQKYGVDVVTAYDKVRTTIVPKLPYCGFKKGNFYLTPSGYMSTCSEIESSTDPRAPLFYFGKYDEKKDKLIFSQEKLDQLYHLEGENKNCDNCHINSFCPGTCFVRGISTEDAIKIGEQIDDLISPLNEKAVNILNELFGENKEAKIQCTINRNLSKKEILLALEPNNIESKTIFKTKLMYQADSKDGIEKIIKLIVV
ncbi:MAG: PqqD family peptide modification chaperone [Desulfobacteraceae bacterium]|nr:PqqD family peptide modification chaperone [Desulfobacteraceae bacterium]